MSGTRPVRTPAGMINVEPVNAPTRTGPAVVQLSSLDTWSVMRIGFVLSLAIAVVITVAVLTLWALFTVTGVFDTVGRNLEDVLDSGSIRGWFSLPRVLGITLVVSAVEVVLTTAALTLVASLYNMTAHWVGGVEATLSDQR